MSAAAVPEGARSIRRRMSPDDRREAIVAVARGVFSRQGLPQTGVRDIAAAAGVSVGTVTYHFSGLAEILAEVIKLETSEIYHGQVVTSSRLAPTGRAQLESFADQLLSGTARMREHWLLWLDFWALSAREPRYSRWRSEIYANWRDEVIGAFRRGAADGSLRDPGRSGEPDADAAAAASFIALVDGLVVQAYLPTGGLTPKRARSIVHRHIAALAGS